MKTSVTPQIRKVKIRYSWIWVTALIFGRCHVYGITGRNLVEWSSGFTEATSARISSCVDDLVLFIPLLYQLEFNFISTAPTTPTTHTLIHSLTHSLYRVAQTLHCTALYLSALTVSDSLLSIMSAHSLDHVRYYGAEEEPNTPLLSDTSLDVVYETDSENDDRVSDIVSKTTMSKKKKTLLCISVCSVVTLAVLLGSDPGHHAGHH